MAMHVADVGKALLGRVRGTQELQVLDAGPWSHQVVRIAAGDTWRREVETAGGISLLVLEGMATVSCSSMRETLGAGHLVVFESVDTVEVTNDSDEAFLALIGEHILEDLESL